MPGEADFSTWRFILSAADSAAMNMAVDEALLLAYLDRASPQTIRVYAWNRPSVTFGRRIAAAEVDRAGYGGADAVRRPTGGGLVYHDRCLTISIAGSVLSLESWALREGLAPASVRRAGLRHRALNSCVRSALVAMGVDCYLLPASASWQNGHCCFSNPCAYDIVSGGGKIYGSAQMVSGSAFLYQGNLLSGGALDAPAFSVFFRRSLEAAFGWGVYEGGLTAVERETAASLSRDKYSSEGWNLLGRFRRPLRGAAAEVSAV